MYLCDQRFHGSLVSHGVQPQTPANFYPGSAGIAKIVSLRRVKMENCKYSIMMLQILYMRYVKCQNVENASLTTTVLQ